jgi:hypothetical protein
VRDEHDRLLALLPDALEVAVELLARHRVERRERLVHQQHARVRGERARERHALLHPARELVHGGVREALEPDEPQVRQRLVAQLDRRHLHLQLQPEHHVVEHVEPREERRLLEHDHAVGAGRAHGLLAHQDASLVGALEARDEVEQRALAATGGSDQAHELALFHVERDVIERMDLAAAPAEALGDVLDRELGPGHLLSADSAVLRGLGSFEDGH